MKLLCITLIMVLSQALMAKIDDFNSIIQEQSRNQKETHVSLSQEALDSTDAVLNPKASTPQIFLIGANSEDLALSNLHATSLKVILPQKPIAVEKKQLIRLGEELNEAQ